jgi:hypothetical protein
MTFKPWHFIVVALAGWMNRQQVDFSHFGRRRTPGIRDSRSYFVKLDHLGVSCVIS